MRASGYLYPWDVVGDPDAAQRIAEFGLDSVVLAASYHSARAATPRHPVHRVVEVADSAFYLPVRDSAWSGQPLVPRPASWMSVESPYGLARDALQAAGVSVDAWVVLHHNSALGADRPELIMVNAFGDPYRYALCPSNAEVRDYSRLLLREVIVQGRPERLIVEAIGFMGIGHQSRHEKTQGSDWTPDQLTLLSVCFCKACRTGLSDRGVDVDDLGRRIRAAVVDGEDHDHEVAEVLGADHDAVLDLRLATVSAVRDLACEEADAGGIAELIFPIGASDWSPVPIRAVLSERPGVGYLAHCWGNTEVAVSGLSVAQLRVREISQDSDPNWCGFVTVLPPGLSDVDELTEQFQALQAAGLNELHLYHLGLASTARLQAARAAWRAAEIGS